MKKLTLLLFLLFTLFMVGCTNPADEYLKDLIIDAEFSENFVLPETVKELPITWTSSRPDVLSTEGFSYIQEEDQTVVMTANITIGEKTYTKDFEVVVEADEEGLFDVAWEYYENKIDKSTVKDMKMFTRNYGQFSIAYKSLNEAIITSDGKINQTHEDQVVPFEVTIIKGNERKIYNINITVSKYTDMQRSKLVLEWVKEQAELFKNKEILELPTTHPLMGTTITWSSNVPGSITPEGKLITPVQITDCKFTYTVTSGAFSYSDYFVYEDFGGADEIEYLKNWLPTIMPTEIKGHKNVVYDQYGKGELFLEYQYEVNTGAVLNLTDGKELTINREYYIDVKNDENIKSTHWTSSYHPAISTDPNSKNLQAVYDHFYDGYTIPNEENILWIVVHESGMPLEGQDAELLAQIQQRRAYDEDDDTQASWNYQVDETGIYQSFDDNVYCWHAGGNYGKWLPYANANSIGIEMCINQDGNYDGSMAHDAKLVASLMHKYNLSMDNVVRHHDTSGKECPSYMIRTNRYEEFLLMVEKEYLAIQLLSDAEVTWTISHPELFEKGPNGLYYSKEVKTPTDVEITLRVVKGTFIWEETSTITLLPDGE